MKSEFERWIGDVWLSDAEWDESKNTYSDSRIHCMWSAWQHQQTKVDELNQELHLVLNNWNDLTRAIHARTNGTAVAEARELYEKVDELQKRVEDLELNIKGAVTFVDLQIEATEQGREAAIGTQAKNWWSSKLLMLRPIRRVLEQALKGGESCQ